MRSSTTITYTERGPQIPKLSHNISNDNLQLRLTVEGLEYDEIYVANIMTHRDNGEKIVFGIVQFSECQVYLVTYCNILMSHAQIRMMYSQ